MTKAGAARLVQATAIGWILLLAVSAAALAETVRLQAFLAGVPPSTASGAAELTLDSEARLLTFRLVYDGLSGPATAGQIAPLDAAAAPVVSFVRPASPILGTKTLSDGEAADLLAGRLAIEIRTAAFPSGELRGAIVK